MKPLLILGLVLLIIAILWLCWQAKPKPFPPHPQRTPALETVPLPENLPLPVERFFRTAYGDRIPVITTVVVKGRGRLAPFGIKFPERFVFVHNAGQDYRHYIEATWFGLPFMKVNERYLDGKGLMEIPVVGTVNDDPSNNQAPSPGGCRSSAPTAASARWSVLTQRSAARSFPQG